MNGRRERSQAEQERMARLSVGDAFRRDPKTGKDPERERFAERTRRWVDSVKPERKGKR